MGWTNFIRHKLLELPRGVLVPVWALGALSIIVLWGATLYDIHADREEALQQAGTQTQSIAIALREHVHGVISSADGILQRVDDGYAHSSGDYALPQWITQSHFLRETLIQVGIISADGQAVATTLPGLGRLDPSDLDPLRQMLASDIDFSALRASICPKLMVAATRVRDGALRIFGNAEMTADVLLASTCPALVNCAIDIEGEAFWDGGYAANPPLLGLARDSEDAELLVVQVTPARDTNSPLTAAAIDRRLDQIAANAVLNAEIAALEWALGTTARLRVHRIAAEDDIDDLAQQSPLDLGRGFVTLLRERGYGAADRWLTQASERTLPASRRPEQEASGARPSVAEPALL